MEDEHDEDGTYKAFGRDTEAGKLIYNLYNSGASKRNAYKPNVKIRTKKTASMGVTPAQEHKIKQRAKYEEVKLKKSHGAAAPRLPQKSYKWHPIDNVQTRKSAAQIDAENAVNFPQFAKGAGKPRGRTFVEAFTREDKIRELQLKMEGRDTSKPKPKPKTQRPSNKSFQEDRADQLVQEIGERQEFLEQMTACGMAAEYESQIKSELAIRVKELEGLDAKIGR